MLCYFFFYYFFYSRSSQCLPWRVNWQTAQQRTQSRCLHSVGCIPLEFMVKGTATCRLNHKKRESVEFFSKQTKHGSAGPAPARTPVVYKQAAQTESCACGRPALPACYCTSRFKSRQSDDEGSWQTITFMFLRRPPWLPQYRVSAAADSRGPGCETGGLAVTLPSGSGPMTLSPSGRGWG